MGRNRIMRQMHPPWSWLHRINTYAKSDHPTHPAEDAKAPVAATADPAEEKVAEARNRVTATLESAREIAGCVRDRAVRVPGRPMKPFVNFRIGPLASAWVSACSSVACSPAGVPIDDK